MRESLLRGIVIVSVMFVSVCFVYGWSCCCSPGFAESGDRKCNRKTSKIVCRYGVGAPERNDLCADFWLRVRDRAPWETGASASQGASAIETYAALGIMQSVFRSAARRRISEGRDKLERRDAELKTGWTEPLHNSLAYGF